MGLYQVYSNYSPGFNFDPHHGGHKFYMGLYRDILSNPGIMHSDTLHSLPLGQLTSKLSFLVNIHIVGKYLNSQSKDR